MPKGVKRGIKIPTRPALRPAPIHLNTQGIAGKNIPPSFIMEGIQKQIDLVISPEILPGSHPGTNQFRIRIEGKKNGIEVLIIIGKIGLRMLAHRLPVIGKPLGKTFQFDHLTFDSRTRLHVQEIIQYRRAIDLWNDNGRPNWRVCRATKKN
jgi:hypothetical protein